MTPTLIIAVIVALVVGAAVGYIVRKSVGESKIGSAEEEAARIMEEATRNTDAIDVYKRQGLSIAISGISF